MPTAAVVIVALAIAWLLLTVLDLQENDGAAPTTALFGIPAAVSALVIQFYLAAAAAIRPEKPMHSLEAMPGAQRVRRSFLWWVLGVLPAGILAGFGVAMLREPDYFFGDGPWMLLWIPVFVALAMLLGAVVWFFLVFPLALLVKAVGLTSRGEGSPDLFVWPIVLLLLGVIAVVGGLSTQFGGVGRAAYGPIIAAVLGVPGNYRVLWEPGLWIVRAILAVILLWFGGRALANRRRTSTRG
ncbi:hypothetical protein Q9R02_05415 [Arthrobacter sp. YJM1]|uniref:ABC transporter permease n=2 Tax=Arthrobacter TaxID=1663 RepID=A0ABU9KHU1_9MICC|nr:hypothetical protein [Arthrobacter sp. YJM1]